MDVAYIANRPFLSRNLRMAPLFQHFPCPRTSVPARGGIIPRTRRRASVERE